MSGAQRRQFLRFQPDSMDYAELDTRKVAAVGDFEPNRTALILDESSRGCSLLAVPSEEYQIGAIIGIKVGKLKVLLAEVRWLKPIDPQAVKIGLQYLE
jgi:hypothetical protein